MSIVLYVFLFLTLAEIGLFAFVSDFIGPWPTVLFTLLTAVVGLSLLRRQSLSAIQRIRDNIHNVHIKEDSLIHGTCLALGAIFLIVPGFLTDFIGLSALIPALRKGIIRQLMGHSIRSQEFSADPIIDGEYEDVTETNPTNSTSKVEHHKDT